MTKPIKKKRPRDLNKLAASIVDAATEGEPTVEDNRNQHAVALGRMGGKKGGDARAAKLSPERRKEIAKKAAESRWNKKSDPN